MESKELLIDNLDNWLECQRLDSELSDIEIQLINL